MIMQVVFGAMVSLALLPESGPVVSAAVLEQAASQQFLEILVAFRPGIDGLRVPRRAWWESEVEVQARFHHLGVMKIPIPAYRLGDLVGDPRVAAVSPVFPVKAMRKGGKALMRLVRSRDWGTWVPAWGWG